MPDGRLEVTDALGRRIIHIDKPVYSIGRRSGNDLQLVGSDVSRDHAEIALDNGNFILRDRGSRYGTYVNGEGITEHQLKHGDLVRLGRSGGAELVFLLEDSRPTPVSSGQHSTSAVDDLHQVAALLEGLRALGSGRVLDDVLALVMDSALEVTGAERGFIMLAGADNELEFKIARGKGRVTLSGQGFETSRKIPEEVFATGQEKMVADLLDGDLANAHMGTVALGIRHVLCTPLKLVRYLDRADLDNEEKRIGVLYLDSREKGALLSRAARASLETLATEAAVAISLEPQPGDHPPGNRVPLLHRVLRRRPRERPDDLLQRGPQPADAVHEDRRQAPRKGRHHPRLVRARHVRGRHDHGRTRRHPRGVQR